ncbi:hypothetical protein BDP55DRAFT_695713 [Colletotrichum godetiae]|uniref:DUF7820 domain-containing protein n=1 Tax=Colletotrichum godetiae TaxID=1209918 RepID=A0AAJ0AI77_9PEZI|nr:uncharacterized protein BDP55DRAFT_695713 [Colletotrichum godetiae]KAK1672913.1 hypothetical protein BDP55DRAFT_695713 [Colletotrichum godetiae]
MDPFHDKAGNERRASLRMSARASLTTDTVDDDDYDLAAMGISDGFRPTNVSASHQPINSTTNHSTGSAVVSRDSPVPQRVTPPRPSSISKPPRSHDPLALRHDGSTSQSQSNGAPMSRVSSASTDSPIIRSESPYEGPSGPSFPYQMYPQRTNSVATSNTARMSERSYAGPRGPTHPYTLYTQNTVTPDTNEGDNIPVGFAGRSDGYHRRIGPDGEEAADLIGPLGHTEELPPYTRYPEQAYTRKQPGEQQSSTPTVQSQQSPQREPEQQQSSPAQQPAVTVMTATVPAIPAGAGGIGLATRNPEFESREDLRLASPSRTSSRTLNDETASQHEINTAAESYAEKGENATDHKWQKRAKKRLFGVVPYWAICLLAVGLVMMGIILGAVIGTFFAKHKKPPGKHQDDEPIPVVIPTATVDVKPLATLPPDLPPMEIGTFGLPPLIASQAPSTCFNDTTQAQAWTCNIPFTSYVMGVSRIANELPISDYTLKLTTFNDSDHDDNSRINMFSWGTQPPLIMDPLKMRLVNDTSEQGRGAAWFAQMTYNKTVVVPEDRFPGVTTTPRKQQPQSKRGGSWDGPPPGMGEFSRKGVKGAQAGDRPWICTWPGTLLEVFVYPAQNNSYQRKPSTTTSRPPAAATFPPSTSTQFLVRGLQTQSPQSSPIPTDRPRRAPPPPYPQVIKFEERRVSLDQTKNAYCRQVEVCDDGQNTVPVLDDQGQPIEVMIMENRQTVAIADSSKRWIHEDSLLVSPRDRPSRTSQLSDCGCIWWFT